MKVEPDNDADRRLLIAAFDQESNSLQVLLNNHIASYIREAFPGMRLVKADHEKYPTLMKVYLEKPLQN
jgi:hypothetical protein